MRQRIGPTALIASAALAAVLHAPASAQTSVRMATSWAGGPHLEIFAKGFANNVDKLTQGKVKFQVFPAGTIGSPLKVTETVQKKDRAGWPPLARLRLGLGQGIRDLRRLSRCSGHRGLSALAV